MARANLRGAAVIRSLMCLDARARAPTSRSSSLRVSRSHDPIAGWAQKQVLIIQSRDAPGSTPEASHLEQAGTQGRA
jgi:hypothetical protein